MINSRFLLGALATTIALAPGMMLGADPDFLAEFSTPPYRIGESVIGVGGWTAYGMREGKELDPVNAMIESAEWDDSKGVLVLEKKGDASSPIRLRNDSFPPMFGTVRLETGMAFEIPAKVSSARTMLCFRDTSKYASPISFGMNYGSEGGLYFEYLKSKDSKISTIVLPRQEMAERSIYRFILTIKSEDGTFDLKVTGQKSNGSPLEYEVSDLPFVGFRGNEIATIFLENNGPNQHYAAYIDEVKMLQK